MFDIQLFDEYLLFDSGVFIQKFSLFSLKFMDDGFILFDFPTQSLDLFFLAFNLCV